MNISNNFIEVSMLSFQHVISIKIIEITEIILHSFPSSALSFKIGCVLHSPPSLFGSATLSVPSSLMWLVTPVLAAASRSLNSKKGGSFLPQKPGPFCIITPCGCCQVVERSPPEPKPLSCAFSPRPSGARWAWLLPPLDSLSQGWNSSGARPPRIYSSGCPHLCVYCSHWAWGHGLKCVNNDRSDGLIFVLTVRATGPGQKA